MEKLQLNAQFRSAVGKGVARKLRSNGFIPSVIYSKGVSTPITLEKKEIVTLLKTKEADHALINLMVLSDGIKKEHISLIKDYQLDPVVGELLHVDFMEVSLDKPVTVYIPIVITAEPLVCKVGGKLNFITREVEVECLPLKIPNHIEFDASALTIGDSVHVSDLQVSQGVTILSDPGKTVLSVYAEAKEAAVEEGEAAEEKAEATES
jgi:large subunit ribosomal protein L25